MLVYPHPKGAKSSYSPNGIHETSGLSGNEALDFLVVGGTAVLAPQSGVIVRLSGHDPALGLFPKDLPVSKRSVFGWSLYLRVADGYFYATHMGARYVHVGQHVVAGQVIGRVGHWPPPRGEGASHTHLGFTHDAGIKAARKRILAVGAAPHVKPIAV